MCPGSHSCSPAALPTELPQVCGCSCDPSGVSGGFCGLCSEGADVKKCLYNLYALVGPKQKVVKNVPPTTTEVRNKTIVWAFFLSFFLVFFCFGFVHLLVFIWFSR